jgi:hypothetical protein
MEMDTNPRRKGCGPGRPPPVGLERVTPRGIDGMGLDYTEAASSICDEVAMHAAHTMLLASHYFVGSNAPTRPGGLHPGL